MKYLYFFLSIATAANNFFIGFHRGKNITFFQQYDIPILGITNGRIFCTYKHPSCKSTNAAEIQMARKIPSISADVTALINLAASSLKSLGEDGARFVDNEAIYCIHNDWGSRDQVAKIQGTFTVESRFSKRKYSKLSRFSKLFQGDRFFME